MNDPLEQIHTLVALDREIFGDKARDLRWYSRRLVAHPEEYGYAISWQEQKPVGFAFWEVKGKYGSYEMTFERVGVIPEYRRRGHAFEMISTSIPAQQEQWNAIPKVSVVIPETCLPGQLLFKKLGFHVPKLRGITEDGYRFVKEAPSDNRS